MSDFAVRRDLIGLGLSDREMQEVQPIVDAAAADPDVVPILADWLEERGCDRSKAHLLVTVTRILNKYRVDKTFLHYQHQHHRPFADHRILQPHGIVINPPEPKT